jgi:uncharacterized SAM-binding protein YcdF (DUF218 family)
VEQEPVNPTGASTATEQWPVEANWDVVLRLLRPVWEFMRLSHRLAPADAIVCMGSNDLSSARYAADLYHRGLAPIVVMSGGMAHRTDLLATGWQQSEAQQFADAARKLGVPREAMLLEETASNTRENFTRVRELLETSGRLIHSGIIVHKPYMERRAYATGRLVWPGIEWSVSSVPCSLPEYLFFNRDPVAAINVMLGDLQRLELYGKKGLLERQAIPTEVTDNFAQLVRLGFDQHLIREASS